MCRLFAMSAGTTSVSARFWLLDAPDSLEVQSRRMHDGTGIGVFDADGSPILDKQAAPAYADPEFIREALEATSTTFVSHVRFATTGVRSEQNTHPFTLNGAIMAHNGGFGELSTLEAELGDAMGDVLGDTDSERYFALITAFTAANGGDFGAGITSAATWIAEHLPLFSLNCIVSTPNELWALRYPAHHGLYVLEREAGGADLPEALHGHGSVMAMHAEDLAQQPAVIIASEPMDDHPDWRELASGELIHVAPDLVMTSTIALPNEPARFVLPSF